MQAEQRSGDAFVQKHGQNADAQTLDQVQRCNTEKYQTPNRIHSREDGTASGYDGIHGHEHLGKSWQQVQGIEGTAEYGHGGGAQGKTANGSRLAPF